MFYVKISEYLSIATASEKKLPFYIASIGNPKFQTIVHRPLGINDHQLLYTVSGTGCCFIDGKTYNICKNNLIYLAPNTPHEYHSTSKWETLYITFNGLCIDKFFELNSSVHTLSNSFNFCKHYNNLYNLKQNPNLYKESSVALYSFLLSLMEHLTKTEKKSKSRTHLMTRAMHYLSENNNISLIDIADEFNISEEHFCRIFKEYTGYRPLEYVNLVKIQKAKELLKNTNYSIGEISAQAGYESHSYFTLLFKKYTGITPIEYRSNQR